MAAQFVDDMCEQAADGAALAIPELLPVIRAARELGPRAEKELRHWTRARALDDRADKWSSRYKTNLELYCGLTLKTLRNAIGSDDDRRAAAS
jgi:hypothetical protein